MLKIKKYQKVGIIDYSCLILAGRIISTIYCLHCMFRRKKTGKGETREDDYEDLREFTRSQDMILASDEKLTTEDALTMAQPPVSESMRKVCDEDSIKVNGFHRTGSHHGGKPKSTSNRSNKKKQWLCCLNMNPFRS